MRSDWIEGVLGDFIEEFIVPQRDKPKSFDGDIPWCRIEDFEGKYLTASKSDKAVTQAQIEEMPLRIFPARSVAVSCSAHLGRCAIVTRPLVTNQTFIGLVCGPKIWPEFVQYALSNRSVELNSIASGTTIKYLAKARFMMLPVALPPLDEQKRIAGILDEANRVRKKTQVLIDKYDELAQSLFLDMFGDPVTNPKGWEVKPLSEFIAKLRSGVSVNSTKDDGGEDFSSPRVLKTSCVTMGFFKPSESKAIVSNEIGRVKLFAEKDTIIISRMNTKDLVAKSAYVGETFDKHFLPDRLWMTEKGATPHNVKWLSFALGQERFRVEVSKSASGTSGSMKNVSQSNFLKTLMIYPPVEAQSEFVQKLQSAEHLRNIQLRALQEAEELFNALLQRAFKGELT